jgi:hypothetical protein
MFSQQPAVLQPTSRFISGLRAIFRSSPIPPTSGDEYRFPSIDIHNRLPAKQVSFQKAPGLGTFHITLVRSLHFHDVPDNPCHLPMGGITGINLRRRSSAMLHPSRDRRNTLAACVPLRGAVFWVVVTPVRVQRLLHPRDTPTLHGCVGLDHQHQNPQTAGCSRHDTSNLYQPLFTIRSDRDALLGVRSVVSPHLDRLKISS